MSEKFVAKDHLEAYDYWARNFDDLSLLANRDAWLTRFKVANVLAALPITPETHLLDVGPGDGALLQLVAPRVARACGVDPIAAAIERLRGHFAATPGVEFEIGSSSEIPHPDASFDVVVMNSVVFLLNDHDEVERSVEELVRVCRPGGCVFIGEVPFMDETAADFLELLNRRVRDLGLLGFARNVYCTYLRPYLRGGVLLTGAAAEQLHFDPDAFQAMCRSKGVEVERRVHREPRRPSTTRSDYYLTRPVQDPT